MSALALVLVPSDGTEASPVSDEYWCYGDNILLEYDGEAQSVIWTATDHSGSVIKETSGSLFRIDASGLEEFYVAQTVTTDKGSTVRNVKVNPLHLNVETYSVVFFDGPGGGIVDIRNFGADTVCKNGRFINMPDPPTVEGQVFGGWYAEDGSEFRGDSPVTADHSVYAGWLDVYSVLFISEGEVYDNAKVVEGECVDLPEPSRHGRKMFAGWYSDRDLVQEYDAAEQVTGDRVLFAKWVEEPGKAGHGDTLSLVVLVPIVLLCIFLVWCRGHKRNVKACRPAPGSSKGRFGHR